MLVAALVCLGLLGLVPEARAPLSADDLKAYEDATARAGRDPEAHIKLALWCEARDLTADRLKHLAVAVLIDPKNTTARGLLGLVAYGGKWRTPDKVREDMAKDEALAARRAEYNARRDDLRQRFGDGRHASRTQMARAHVALGMWCEANQLKPEATAHFTTAVTLDPYHEATWKHLGYVKYQGRWRSPEQVAVAEREADARSKALAVWLPKLKRWRADLSGSRRAAKAREELAGVVDPHAVAAVVRVFRTDKEADELMAVQLLGQIDHPDSTRGLAEFAVFSPSATARATATEILRGREPRDFAELLIARINTPIRYRVDPVKGPGAPGALTVETPRYHIHRTYDAPPAFRLNDLSRSYVGYDERGLPVVAVSQEVRRVEREGGAARVADLARIEERTASMIATAQLKAVDSQQRLIADVYDIEATNARYLALNERILPVLEGALAAPDLKDDEDAWKRWWNDRLGYSYVTPPPVEVTVSASTQLPPASLPRRFDCFAAGTLVRALDGPRPIEGLRVGDQVLSQDVSTGALSFQPVLVVLRLSTGETLRLTFEDAEELTVCVYHRFWRAGLGWSMARELKPGDRVRTVDGVARIASISKAEPQPLYNLDVAESRTFFVGRRGALVHDNTLPDPHLKPFDAEPVLAATAPSRLKN